MSTLHTLGSAKHHGRTSNGLIPWLTIRRNALRYRTDPQVVEAGGGGGERAMSERKVQR